MHRVLDRRSIMMLPLFCGAPTLCKGEEQPSPDVGEMSVSLGLSVAEGLVGGAASFVGGQIMKYYFSKPDSTPEVIESFISKALKRLSAELTSMVKTELRQQEIALLSSEARASQRSLALFSRLDDRAMKRQRSILDGVLRYTSASAERCLDFGVEALPAYAIFISQRVFVAEAFARLDQDTSIVAGVADELQSAGREIYNRTYDYLIALSPDHRLGPLQCSDESTGSGGFGVRYYTCQFTQDGSDLPENRYSAIAPKPANDWLIKTNAEDVLRKRVVEIDVFRGKQQTYFVEPLCRIADKWGGINVAIKCRHLLPA